MDMNIGLVCMIMLVTCLYQHGDACTGTWYSSTSIMYTNATYTAAPPKVSTSMTSQRTTKTSTSHKTTKPSTSHTRAKPSTEPLAAEGDGVSSEYIYLPPWMLYAEVSTIVASLLIVLGLLACCCLKVFGFSVSRDRRKERKIKVAEANKQIPNKEEVLDL